MIYAYIKDKKKQQQIETLCASLKEGFTPIGPKDLNTCVKTLVGVDSFGTKNGKKPAAASFKPQKPAPMMYAMQEILIFSGIQDEKLDLFLSEYRNAGIEPIPLKAVVTPYNIMWSLYELIEHLIDEHNIMKNM